MSVGLDALNKLQQQRSAGGVEPQLAAVPAPSPKRRASLWLVIGFAVAATIAGTVHYRSHRRAVPARVAFAIPPHTAERRPAPAAAPAAVGHTPDLPPAIRLGSAAVTGISSAPAPVLVPSSAAAVAPAHPAPQIFPPVTPPHSPASFTPDPVISDFVTAVRVDGIRVGDSRSPMVLFNDAVYRLNEQVNIALGLRLVGIEANRLTFQDSRGVLYTKSFGGP